MIDIFSDSLIGYDDDGNHILLQHQYRHERRELMRFSAGKPTKVTIYCAGGKQAVIDFSTDTVHFSGDCQVDEAARVFFEAVGIIQKQARQQSKEDKP